MKKNMSSSEDDNDDDDYDIEKNGKRISLDDLIKLLTEGIPVDIRINSLPMNRYDTFGMKMINVIFEHFPQGFPMDYMKLFDTMVGSFMSILNSQMGSDPNFLHVRQLSQKEKREITHDVMNYMGHLLALKNIAKPRTESDPP
jgi:hypothetical protein